MGFYTTRWVVAETHDEAEQAALAMLRSDELLVSLKDLRRTEEPVARVTFEEIEETTDIPSDQSGFTWFDMESANNSESECRHDDQD